MSVSVFSAKNTVPANSLFAYMAIRDSRFLVWCLPPRSRFWPGPQALTTLGLPLVSLVPRRWPSLDSLSKPPGAPPPLFAARSISSDSRKLDDKPSRHRSVSPAVSASASLLDSHRRALLPQYAGKSPRSAPALTAQDCRGQRIGFASA